MLTEMREECLYWRHKLADRLEYITLSCIPTQSQVVLDSNWPANILAGLNFPAQENGLMSPHGVCAINAGPAGHKTTHQ